MAAPIRFQAYSPALNIMIRLLRRVPGPVNEFQERFSLAAKALHDLPNVLQDENAAREAIGYWIKNNLPEPPQNTAWLSLRGLEQTLREEENFVWKQFFYEGIEPASDQNLPSLSHILALTLDRLVLAHGETFSATTVDPAMILTLFHYLFGESNAEEEAALRHWTDASPEHMELFDAAYTWFEALELNPGERAPEALELWSEGVPGQKFQQPKKKFPFNRSTLLITLGGAILLLVIIGGYEWFRLKKRSGQVKSFTHQVWQSEGGLRIVQIDSTITGWLSPNSTLEQTDSKAQRVLILNGTAVFDIKSTEPTIIQTPHARLVTARGHFSVNTKKEFEVRQLGDTLRMLTTKESLLLITGQVARYDATSGTLVRTFAHDSLIP